MRRPVPSRLVLLLGNHLYFTQPVDATAPALTYPSFPKCLGLLSESPLPTAARRSADHLLLMESPSLPIHCHDAARYVTVAPHFGGLISGRSLSLRCRPVRKAGPCADRRLHIRFETVILQCNTTFDDLRFLFNQTIFFRDYSRSGRVPEKPPSEKNQWEIVDAVCLQARFPTPVA